MAKAKICMARVPASTYKALPRRCEKPARVELQGLDLCRHHEAVAKRRALEVWSPALEPKGPQKTGARS